MSAKLPLPLLWCWPPLLLLWCCTAKLSPLLLIKVHVQHWFPLLSLVFVSLVKAGFIVRLYCYFWMFFMDSRCFGGRFGATGFIPIELKDCIVCKSGLVLVVGNATFFLQKLQWILVMEAMATFHHENWNLLKYWIIPPTTTQDNTQHWVSAQSCTNY